MKGAHALRELVMPVVVVTASDGVRTSCATATTSYVSLSPPVLSVALSPESRTARLTMQAGRFGVSVLAAGQAEVAVRAGRSSTADDKLADVGIGREDAEDPAWPPGVAGAASVLWCAVTQAVPVGDHLVIFGEVERWRAGTGQEDLLLRHRRRYLSTGQALSDYAPEGYPI
jgi:flavin reductase (DIM6/NTAB) family NADH-FMN oxidoreductase RutF